MRILRSLTPGRIVCLLFLVLFVVVSILPPWIAFKTALTQNADLYETTADLVPTRPTLMNVLRVLVPETVSETDQSFFGKGSINFGMALRNSAIFTVLVVTGQIFFSAMAAYAFARIRFFGRNLLFFLMICATMVPSIVLFIPNFILIKELGWLNTFAGMVAPYFLMTPFSVFFLRQFFLSTPVELEEAARLDGASRFTTFWRIILPVHKSAVATLAILTIINTWNEFFWPFLVGYDQSVRVISVAINAFREQTAGGVPDWSGLMACTVLSIIPIMILLVFFGRRVVESLQFTGMK